MSKIAVGQTCLAYHRDQLYEAKVLEAQEQPALASGYRYFIHYNGWGNKFNEWVPGDRLLEDTVKSRELKQQLLDSALASKASSSKKKSGGIKSKAPKRALSDSDGDEADGSAAVAAGGSAEPVKPIARDVPDRDTVAPDSHDPRVVVALPFSLKKRLADDWEFINQKKFVVKVPKSKPVGVILAEFMATTKKGRGGVVDKAASEICECLRGYFDRALGVSLLYRLERPQYEALIAENEKTVMSQTYGAEHLLRLLLKLPELLALGTMPPPDMSKLRAKLQEILKYLQDNQDTLFTNEYIAVNEEYLQLAAPPS